MDATWPQRKRTTKEHLEERSGEGGVDSRRRMEVHGSKEQSWVKKSGLWLMFHRQQTRLSQSRDSHPLRLPSVYRPKPPPPRDACSRLRLCPMKIYRCNVLRAVGAAARSNGRRGQREHTLSPLMGRNPPPPAPPHSWKIIKEGDYAPF